MSQVKNPINVDGLDNNEILKRIAKKISDLEFFNLIDCPVDLKDNNTSCLKYTGKLSIPEASIFLANNLDQVFLMPAGKIFFDPIARTYTSIWGVSEDGPAFNISYGLFTDFSDNKLLLLTIYLTGSRWSDIHHSQ